MAQYYGERDRGTNQHKAKAKEPYSSCGRSRASLGFNGAVLVVRFLLRPRQYMHAANWESTSGGSRVFLLDPDLYSILGDLLCILRRYAYSAGTTGPTGGHAPRARVPLFIWGDRPAVLLTPLRMTMPLNNCVQATPGCALLFAIAQVPGAPDANR